MKPSRSPSVLGSCVCWACWGRCLSSVSPLRSSPSSSFPWPLCITLYRWAKHTDKTKLLLKKRIHLIPPPYSALLSLSLAFLCGDFTAAAEARLCVPLSYLLTLCGDCVRSVGDKGLRPSGQVSETQWNNHGWKPEERLPVDRVQQVRVNPECIFKHFNWDMLLLSPMGFILGD